MKPLLLTLALISFFLSSAQINYPNSTKPLFKKEITKKQSVYKEVYEIVKKKDSFAAKKIMQVIEKTEVEIPESRIEIEGLGNFTNSQNGSQLSPSANVFALLRPLPSNGNLKFYLGFNLGSEIDSSKIDSIKLAGLFLPDRGKSGYLARAEFNILSIFNSGYSEEGDEGGKPKYKFVTEINPFIEYNYHKINIKEAAEDSSRIQTSTWIIGLNFAHIIQVKENSIGLQFTPFWKQVTVTDGTVGLYREIFRPALKGANSPQTVNFLGLSIGLQVNRFLFSFVFEDLKTKSLANTPLFGGVYTLRASVTGEFLKL